jgi:hypothetical protein
MASARIEPDPKNFASSAITTMFCRALSSGISSPFSGMNL